MSATRSYLCQPCNAVNRSPVCKRCGRTDADDVFPCTRCKVADARPLYHAGGSYATAFAVCASCAAWWESRMAKLLAAGVARERAEYQLLEEATKP